MKRKPKVDEYRMKASEFDAIMRGALATPPEPKPNKVARKKATKKAAAKK